MPNAPYNSWRGCANNNGFIERLVLSVVEVSRDAQYKCPMPQLHTLMRSEVATPT
ncbi:hypothetical protein [Nostoc sp.]|uniref:hypothetical protein n=1 Tax=Nostoc sp. TaxID=1180 RepID=UPI002FFA4529